MGVIFRVGEEAAGWGWLQARASERIAEGREGGTLAVLASPALARAFGEALLSHPSVHGIGWLRARDPLALAEEIFRRARLPHRRALPAHLKVLLLERILAAAELRHFRAVSELSGFVKALGELFSEIAASAVTPDELDGILSDSPKNREITTLYRRYRETLAGHDLCERSDLLHEAAELLRAAPELAGGADEAVIFGFSRFSPPERALIEALAAAVAKVEVLGEAIPAGRGVRDPLSDLTDSPDWPFGDSREALPGASDRAESLRHLTESLFADAAPTLADAAGAVRVLSGAGGGGERGMIAREIRRLVACEGFAYSEILVLSRSSEECAALKEVFEPFEIPVDVAISRPVLESPLVASLLTLLRAATTGWPREETLAVIRSPFTGLSPDDADAVEMAARRKGIFSGREAWLSGFEPEALRESLQGVLNRIAQLEIALAKPITADDFREAVRRTIDRFQMVPRAAKGDRLRAGAELRALDQLVCALDELTNAARILAIEKLPGADFIALLKDALTHQKLSEALAHPNGVRIRPVQAASPARARVVFMTGMVEGNFPAQPREGLFFRDREVREMARKSRLKLEEGLRRPERERGLFLNAVGRATERLYFTHTASGADGRPVLRSFYVDEALAPFAPESIVHNAQDISRVVAPVAEACTHSELDLAVLQGLTEPKDSRWESFEREASWLSWAWANLADRERLEAVLKLAEEAEKAIPGAVADPDLRALLDQKSRHLDSSGLEAYGACPFRFFLSSVMRLSEVREGVDALSVGSAIHNVLNLLIGRVRERFGDTGFTPERRAEILEIARELVERESHPARFREERRYRVEMTRRKLLAAMERFVPGEELYQASTGARPMALEVRFGARARDEAPDPLSTDTPLEIPGDDGEMIAIVGRIDRVDVLSDGRVVLCDYKSGEGKLSPKDLEEGRSFQLPLYLMAAKEVFGFPPAAALLIGLRKGARAGLGVDGPGSFSGDNVKPIGKGFAGLEESILGWVREYSARIRDDRFPVEPSATICRICDFDTICRRDAALAEDEEGGGDDA